MKNEEFPRLSIVGNANASDQEIFGGVLKQWRKRFAYASIFAAVPALVVSQLQAAQTVEAKQPESHYPGRGAQPLNKLNSSPGKRALLKRQSQFLLPHQKGNFAMAATVGGNDECPGAAIPGGNYTAAAPYIQVGDTNGANDTVTRLTGYYYYYNAHGPDRVYSFTLTGRGPNPQIEVSATSGAYRPLIYVLPEDAGGCPAGTGNLGNFTWAVYDSRWTDGNTATLSDWPLNNLPLNVPLHLFVDSAENDGSGAGPYTIRMQDVTIAPVPDSNPIDGSEFFVRQHYRDFLNRESDPDGLAFWTSQITSCGGDQACIEARRINDSGSFFLSIEFQETGYLVYRLYKAAYGDIPNSPLPVKLNEFTPDTEAIGRNVIVKQAGWEQVLENNKRVFVADFVQRSRFTAAFVPSMSASEFVDKLDLNAGNPLSSTERDQLASDLLSGNRSRADVLRAIAEHPNLAKAEFNRAFVLMQYFGYLRRNPDDAPDGNFVGYNFWLDKLNQFNGDFVQAEMVKAFLSSGEYRRRFGQ